MTRPMSMMKNGSSETLHHLSFLAVLNRADHGRLLPQHMVDAAEFARDVLSIDRESHRARFK